MEPSGREATRSTGRRPWFARVGGGIRQNSVDRGQCVVRNSGEFRYDPPPFSAFLDHVVGPIDPRPAPRQRRTCSRVVSGGGAAGFGWRQTTRDVTLEDDVTSVARTSRPAEGGT